jgi:uncharacterized protein (DUF1015 family)
MASVAPITAMLVPPEHAEAVASVPYDVVDSAEAAALADGNPRSFLHVIRPEIDLPAGTGLYDDVVYAAAADALQRVLAELAYTEEGDTLLVYRLVQGDRVQTGVVGGCSVDEYDAGGIAIHERTRQKKEDDRARHVTQMRCQAEPIFLAYRGQASIDALVEGVVATEPLYDFEAVDGVRHTVWRAPDAAGLSAAFEAVPKLYVADGHHRAKSASRARATLAAGNPDHTGDEAYNRVLAVVFPDSQLTILPYNRVVTDLGGRTAEQVLDAIAAVAPLLPADSPSPDRRGCFAVYGAGRWQRFALSTDHDGVIENLDVSLLQDQVLQPVFGIDDPRTDERIQFVGGSRGTAELERRADATGGVAFSLFPTSMAELFAVADRGEIMPPKSTWFEPKLRSGLFVHRI